MLEPTLGHTDKYEWERSAMSYRTAIGGDLRADLGDAGVLSFRVVTKDTLRLARKTIQYPSHHTQL